MPELSVIMPVYNGAAYLRAAIDSILVQTFTDYEFIIVDDGSSDESAAIVESYADARIRLLRNSTNLGVVGALNRGLEVVRAPLIARMDCDDVSRPERFAKQLAFLRARPEVGVCGTWLESIGERRGYIWRFPITPEQARCTLLFETALAHPSVIMRRELLERFDLSYSLAYEHAEDYGLWLQLSRRCALANLPEVLVYYRKHPAQTGIRQRVGLRAAASRIRQEQLAALGIVPTPEQAELHDTIGTMQFESSPDFVAQVDSWLLQIRSANRQAQVYDPQVLDQILGQRWYRICRWSARLGFWSFRAFWRSPLSAYAGAGALELLRFGVRALL